MQDHWQKALHEVICDPIQLLSLLDLPLDETVYTASQAFNLRVPKSYIARMRKGDLHDPLLRQILPLAIEKVPVVDFSVDPTGDKSAEKRPQLLHKYQNRILLLVSNVCALHCRYCFRRHHRFSAFSFTSDLYTYIRANTAITEVILSGGDPLCLSDYQLGEIIQTLATIPHLQRLRIHTRLPIVLSERITTALLTALTNTRLQPVLVVHANHANEIDKSVTTALKKLTGITVLNQSVLLRGINDDSETLVALSEVLFQANVLPYYLHQLDRVQGATHFEVPVEKAYQLVEQMRPKLPGYLVPKLVKEVPGLEYKQVLIE